MGEDVKDCVEGLLVVVEQTEQQQLHSSPWGELEKDSAEVHCWTVFC